MKNDHIGNIAMSLYVTGYRHLKKSVIKQIQEHLAKCGLCAGRFEEQFQETGSREGVGALMKPRMKSPVLQTLAEFLKLPSESPLGWKKLEAFYEQLAAVLSERGITEQQKRETRWLSLVTKGYMHVPTAGPGKKERQTDPKQKKPSLPKSQKDELRMSDRIRSLLEIFADGRIHISKRAALAEELLSLAIWHLQKDLPFPSQGESKRSDGKNIGQRVKGKNRSRS